MNDVDQEPQNPALAFEDLRLEVRQLPPPN